MKCYDAQKVSRNHKNQNNANTSGSQTCIAADKPTFHSTRKTSPISEDEQWQTFTIEIFDCLCCLVCGVRKPNLASLLLNLGFYNASTVITKRNARNVRIISNSLKCRNKRVLDLDNQEYYWISGTLPAFYDVLRPKLIPVRFCLANIAFRRASFGDHRLDIFEVFMKLLFN